MTHYYRYHLQGRLKTICRGGLASCPYQTVSTNHAFVGAVPRLPLQIDLQRWLVLSAAPTNRFVGAAVVPGVPIIPICRGGSVQNRPYNTFSCKKNQIYNSNSTRTTLFISAYSCVRVVNERSTFRTAFAQRPTECPATNVPNRVRSRVLYKL